MKIELKGRKAIVTGSTAGIGRAIAEGLARAGASVVVNGRGRRAGRRSPWRIYAPCCPTPNSPVWPRICRRAEGSASLVARCADADILVNNVGTAHPKGFFEQDDSEWLDLFQLNVMSGVRAARHYLPAMVQRGWGRVVFHQQRVRRDDPEGDDRLRHDQDGATRRVARTGRTRRRHRRPRSNAVLPGPTRSEILSNWMKATAADAGISEEEAEQNFLKTMRPTTLINRFTSTEEVANMVVYVCSEQASGTSGAALRVDGGVIRAIP